MLLPAAIGGGRHRCHAATAAASAAEPPSAASSRHRAPIAPSPARPRPARRLHRQLRDHRRRTTPRSPIADLARLRAGCRDLRCRLVSRLRVMVPPPLPEELLDLRHVASRRRCTRPTCRRSLTHGRADERLAVGVGQLDLAPSPSRPACTPACDGSTSTLSTRFSGGTTISLRLGVDLAVGDGHRLDEEVRHVLLARRRSPRRCSCPSAAAPSARR